MRGIFDSHHIRNECGQPMEHVSLPLPLSALSGTRYLPTQSRVSATFSSERVFHYSMTNLAFVGSTIAHLRFSRQMCRCDLSQPSRPSPQRSHPHCDAGLSRKQRKRERPSVTLEKRRKQYFFRLLSAARNRDKRLLLAVVTALGQDQDYLRSKSALGTSDPLHLEDVLLKAASRCGQTSLADKLFQSMVAKGQSPTQHTAGAFLDALKLSNKPDRCIAVFREMMDVGVDLGDVCFNIVVSALVQDGDFNGGMDMLESATTKWGITPDVYTFNIFLGAALKHNTRASAIAAAKAQALMVEWGVAPDRVTINARISAAIKQGRLDEAIEIFDKALNGDFPGIAPDVMTFNIGISAFMALHRDDRAFQILREMDARRIRPRADTFNTILTGLTKMRRTEQVVEVFNQYLRQDDSGDETSVTPSLVTYNLVLQALCLDNDKGQARLVDDEMRRRRVKPDNVTLAALVRLQYNREDVYGVMETACKLRIKPSLAFLNSCIRALAEHGDLHGAFHVMDRICALEGVVPDAFSYNSLIYALVQEPWVSQVVREMVIDDNVTSDMAVIKCLGRTSGGDGRETDVEAKITKQSIPERANGGIAGRLDGLLGANAALLLLEEMKSSAHGSQASPDVFTYTTVISGVARAEDAHRSLGFGPRSWRRLKHESRNPSVGVEDDIEDDSNKVFVSSSERCKQLYLEAMDRGVKINGKICSAVMLGFGCDLAGAISFWKEHVRPTLNTRSDGAARESGKLDLNAGDKRKEDLFSAYCGLLHVCGRANRPDAAVKVVAALRKDGIKPTSAMSNTYFKAKKEMENIDNPSPGRASFRIIQLVEGQMENLLEVECGISKHSQRLNLPVERIRIRF